MADKKKILITGGKWMLAYDFSRTQKEKYEIILVDRNECDITSFESVMQCIALHSPDVLLNCAAYTAVDDAEDIGMKMCFDVNALGVKNLAKATSVFWVEFITISTDYVFDGKKLEGYLPSDECNPINTYGMSKYLGERLAIDENPRTIIVRTSWLYGGEVYDGKSEKKWVYKNFVNTMLRLSETRDEVKVVSDQYGIPTSCVDLSCAISEIIEQTFDQDEIGGVFHFSNSAKEGSLTWADFAREIFTLIWKNTKVIDCSSSEYLTKAKRPSHSILNNDSHITLPDWKIGLARYLEK
jgi:dTDP-4-dehydrorhamnose reductase